MQVLFFKALLLCAATLVSGMRVQVATTGRACDASSIYCKCTTEPIPSLTLLSDDKIDFGIKSEASFAVSGPGFEAIKNKNSGVEMECIEETIPHDTTCHCNGAGAGTVQLQTGQCLYNSDPRMCLDEELHDLKYLRCYSRNKETGKAEKYAYAKAPYNVPKVLDLVQLKHVEYCQPWTMHRPQRPVQCYYQSKYNFKGNPSENDLRSVCEEGLATGTLAVKEYKQVGTFKVVNSIGSKYEGLAYRNSKYLDDKADRSVNPSQKWNSTVEGQTTGDGWLGTNCSGMSCKLYLPMFWGGKAVVEHIFSETAVTCELQMKLEKCLDRLEAVKGDPLAYFW